MRIGVISDTHLTDSTKELPQKVIEEFKHVDMVIHSGDLVDISVLDKLRKLCKNVTAVWGNMDPEEIKNSLPEKTILKVGNYRIGVVHGYGAPNKLIDALELQFKCDSVDIVIFGHTHNSVNEIRNGILFFNPGSATDKVFSKYNSIGIIEINDKIDAQIIRI